MADNLHSGHRERMRERFLKQGINENTPPHEILEVLLFYSIPRQDTNELAHELINRFGSLSAVLDAPYEELIKVKGINKNSITLFKLLMPIARAYIDDKKSSPKKFFNITELGDYLLRKYLGVTKEVFSVVWLDAACGFLDFEVLSEGGIKSVAVSSRSLVASALKSGAACAVICHNHPGGLALPSGEDLSLTAHLREALLHIDVELIDHIIIADDDYTSLYQSEKYKPIFSKDKYNYK